MKYDNLMLKLDKLELITNQFNALNALLLHGNNLALTTEQSISSLAFLTSDMFSELQELHAEIADGVRHLAVTSSAVYGKDD